MNKLAADFGQMAGLLRGARRVLVFSHVRPDGDAIGSLLAMGLALVDAGVPHVEMWSEDGVPESLSFLPSADRVKRPPAEPAAFDVVVAVDTAAKKRGGERVLGAIADGATVVNIDHHVSNEGYGDVNHVDPAAPATGQILYEFLTDQGFPITANIGQSLYAAIATDTGFFQYPRTSARTHEIVAAIVRTGVDLAGVAAMLNGNSSRRRFELMRVFLDCAKFECDGRLVSSALSMADTQSVGATPEDSEGLIDLIRGVAGVRVAIFFEEMPEQKVRISMRSKSPEVDVSELCGRFGGGGHPAAAGARVAGDLAGVQTQVLELVRHAIA